jgi:hypothetical protein
MVFLIAVLSLIVGCVLVLAAFAGSDYLLASRRGGAEPVVDWLAGTPFARPGGTGRRFAIAFSMVVAALLWVAGALAAVVLVMLGIRELLRLAV